MPKGMTPANRKRDPQERQRKKWPFNIKNPKARAYVRGMAELSRREWVDRYNAFFGDLLGFQTQLIDFMRGRAISGAQFVSGTRTQGNREAKLVVGSGRSSTLSC